MKNRVCACVLALFFQASIPALASNSSPASQFAAAIGIAEQRLQEASTGGERALQEFLAGAVEHAWALSGKARYLAFPRFSEQLELVGMPGLVNPDTRYSTALLDGDGIYRVHGVRGSHVQLTLQFIDSYPMIGLGRDLLVIDFEQLGILPGQAYELNFGGPEQEGHWWPLPEKAKAVVARQTFSDWRAETASSLQIERMNTEASVPASASASADERFELAAHYLGQIIELWAGRYLNTLRQLPVNQFPPIRPSAKQGGGLSGQYAVLTRFKLADDEALIITLAPSSAAYQSIQIGDDWFVTPDPLHRLSSLNAHRASLSSDDNYHVVVSRRDPQYVNWLDASGLNSGYVMVRWQAITKALTAEDQPRARLVKLSEVFQALPKGAEKVKPSQRAAQIASRADLPALKSAGRLSAP